jgi:hypothetical protein
MRYNARTGDEHFVMQPPLRVKDSALLFGQELQIDLGHSHFVIDGFMVGDLWLQFLDARQCALALLERLANAAERKRYLAR